MNNLKTSIKNDILEEIKNDAMKLIKEKARKLKVPTEKKTTDHGLQELKEEIKDIKNEIKKSSGLVEKINKMKDEMTGKNVEVEKNFKDVLIELKLKCDVKEIKSIEQKFVNFTLYSDLELLEAKLLD